MSLEMRTRCEKCGATLSLNAEAYICSFECTFCPACSDRLKQVCKNCSGPLERRPLRVSANA